MKSSPSRPEALSGSTHRILLLNHYAGSPDYGMEYRSYYFAREWARMGHTVLVIGAGFSHLRHTNPAARGLAVRETLEGVDYLWLRAPRYRGNGPGRILNMLAYMAGVYGTCRSSIASLRPDLVIASSTYPWDNWPASRYARRHGARHVYELHDLWPLSPMELGGMSARHPFIRSLQLAENFACRNADRVISILPGTCGHLVAHGLVESRFAHVPNGIVPDEWVEPEPLPDGLREQIHAFARDRRFLLGYVGGHGLSNALDTLIEASGDSRLRDVGIVCVGQGPEKERLMADARAKGGNVLFLPPVPKHVIPSLLPLFDALYIGWKRSPLYRFGISPNKVFEYMIAGVPVIHAVEAANDPVQDACCGISVEPENVDALCAGIHSLLMMPLDVRESMGKRGLQYVKDYHSIHDLARRFLNEAMQPDEQVD